MTDHETYPPQFRNKNQNQNIHDLDRNVWVRELDQVPIVDLQAPSMKNLDDACKNWGVFRLVNHGIPFTLLTKLEKIVANLFNMSFESKQALFDNLPISYFWGTPALTSSGTSILIKDHSRLEGFNVPLCKLSELEHVEDVVIDSFKTLMEEYGNHLTRIAKTVFEIMVMHLNLDPIKTKPNLSEPTGFVRLHRYPCSSKFEEEEEMGLNEHTDSSVLSILFQDKVGGLEVLRDDKWIVVEPTPNTLIVNLGDIMQAMSNDKYKSVTHRVKTTSNKDRISICYFVFPEGDSVIDSVKYRQFTYNEYKEQVHEDIKTLGSKVGLERFRLSVKS